MANTAAAKPKKPVKLPPHKQPIKPPPTIQPYNDPGPGDPVGGGPAVLTDQIRASLKANPNASKGGYEGVGTPAHPGPGGTTNYGNSSVDQSAASDPSQDWASAFFGALGLPDDVMSQVKTILSDHAEDPNLAQALATQYIRSTPWYAVHYPGALEGIAKGVIGSEADYASYVNQVNVLSRQYQGRDVSGDEIKSYLQAGYDPSYVGKLYGGQAWAAANKNDVNYALGAFGAGAPAAGDLTALGNENSGLDSALGQRLQLQLQQATQRLHTIFQGSLATPSLSIGNNGLSSPSLLGANTAQQSDVGT